MPRNPFAGSLFRIIRLVSDAERAGVHPDELAARRAGSSTVSRRAMLSGALSAVALAGCARAKGLDSASPQAAGSASASALAEAHPAPEAAPQELDVLVVGGGLAGLLCAYRLQGKVNRLRVYESSSRAGGRVYSARGKFPDGQVAEYGGELIDTGHQNMRRLAKEMGLTLVDLKPGGTKDEPLYFVGKHLLRERDLVQEFRSVVPVLDADRKSLGEVGVPYKNQGKGLRELDRMSIEQWLQARKIGGKAAGLLRVAFTTELGLEPDELSCVAMLQMLSADAKQVQLYGESDERYTIAGGNDQLSQKLVEGLGDRVVADHALEALRRLADGRYEATFRSGNKSVEVRADRVVLALPFTRLRAVKLDGSLGLPEAKMRSIKELGYGTNAKLILGFRERFWRKHSWNGEVFTDLPALQSSWETSRGQRGDGGIITVFRGGRAGLGAESDEPQSRPATITALSNVLQARQVKDGMKHLSEDSLQFYWAKHAHSLGSYSTWKVGQMTAFGGVEAEPVDGLHFAGEHTSLAYQGFMEGAAESGERAAREVLGVAEAVPRAAE